MSYQSRQSALKAAKTILIKIGSNVLTNDDDSLDKNRFEQIAEQVHKIRQTGKRVVIISSGAVSVGMERLELTERPVDLPHLQAVAAAGQAQLIGLYDQAFAKHQYHVAQMLLTGEDFTSRLRYLNVRNTLRTLFEYSAIPIINENDTVSTDEVAFGDNDSLAAMVANLLEAPLLIILSSVDGLYNGDPESSNSKVISTVAAWENSLIEGVTDEKSSRGKGGMEEKLKAIHKAVSVGENVFLANGKKDNILQQILDGEEVGTFFPAQTEFLPAFKRWIGYTIEPKGILTIDAGAHDALQAKGRSLLPIGITHCSGSFQRGELVSIQTAQGDKFARGLSSYSSEQIQEILGKRTEEIKEQWGNIPFEVVIHRDNLVVTNQL